MGTLKCVVFSAGTEAENEAACAVLCDQVQDVSAMAGPLRHPGRPRDRFFFLQEGAVVELESGAEVVGLDWLARSSDTPADLDPEPAVARPADTAPEVSSAEVCALPEDERLTLVFEPSPPLLAEASPPIQVAPEGPPATTETIKAEKKDSIPDTSALAPARVVRRVRFIP